jgi:hypothetical protein
MWSRPGTIAFLSLALAACASTAPPRLTPFGEPIPDEVSIAGRWELQPGATEFVRQPDGGLQDLTASSRRDRSRARPPADGPSVSVFLRTGSALRITQTSHGLFVSFDRSVVEEYRFGEHRLVNVGPIEADRASGWVNGRYLIQTLDGEGALLEESYALEAGDDVLVRTVTIVHDKKEVLALRQTFGRKE